MLIGEFLFCSNDLKRSDDPFSLCECSLSIVLSLVDGGYGKISTAFYWNIVWSL